MMNSAVTVAASQYRRACTERENREVVFGCNSDDETGA